MNNVYVRVASEYATPNNSNWTELECGDFMQRLTHDEIITHFTLGWPSQLYIEATDGEIVAKPFENLGLFGAQPEPAMRFTKARIEAIAE